MGWNTLEFLRPHPLLAGLESGISVYFVHSYHVLPGDPAVVVATSDYPEPFPAIVARDNLVACQFHPEKSQAVGLRMYANFGRM
jgi:glutamine amidotransferase